MGFAALAGLARILTFVCHTGPGYAGGGRAEAGENGKAFTGKGMLLGGGGERWGFSKR